MLRLVDPTNVADAASAGEGTCVERISPMEGEAIALALFPSARDQQFESLSLHPTRRYAIAEVTRGLFEPFRSQPDRIGPLCPIPNQSSPPFYHRLGSCTPVVEPVVDR